MRNKGMIQRQNIEPAQEKYWGFCGCVLFQPKQFYNIILSIDT